MTERARTHEKHCDLDKTLGTKAEIFSTDIHNITLSPSVQHF